MATVRWRVTCGTGDRMENELTYLDSALATLERVQSDDESPFDIVAVDEK